MSTFFLFVHHHHNFIFFKKSSICVIHPNGGSFCCPIFVLVFFAWFVVQVLIFASCTLNYNILCYLNVVGFFLPIQGFLYLTLSVHDEIWQMGSLRTHHILKKLEGVRVMVFNATFNNILVISWQSVLFMEETGVPGENHWPVASGWQTLSHNVVSSTPRLNWIQTHNISGDRHWWRSYISNYHDSP